MQIDRTESVSIVVGSLILGILRTMDQSQQIKGSTVSYTQLVRAKIYKSKATKEDRKLLAETAHDSMIMLVDQFKDHTTVMQVATFIESLSFSFERELAKFFGNEYMIRMMRFTEKQIVDSGLAKDSYKISDQLKDNIRKIIFSKLSS